MIFVLYFSDDIDQRNRSGSVGVRENERPDHDRTAFPAADGCGQQYGPQRPICRTTATTAKPTATTKAVVETIARARFCRPARIYRQSDRGKATDTDAGGYGPKATSGRGADRRQPTAGHDRTFANDPTHNTTDGRVGTPSPTHRDVPEPTTSPVISYGTTNADGQQTFQREYHWPRFF